MRKDLVAELGLTSEMEVIQVKDRKIVPFSIEENIPDSDFTEIKAGVESMREQAALGNREAWFAGLSSSISTGEAPKVTTHKYRIVFIGSAMSKSLKP